MAPPNEHRITSIQELRARLGEPRALTIKKVLPRLDAGARDFIAASPFLVLATADAAGLPRLSPKGDAPGFVAVEGDATLLIPDRKGNKLLFGLENILANPAVAVLFLVPGTDETLRVEGRAELRTDPEVLERLTARRRPALLAVRVTVERAFFHCAKAFRRACLWQPETWPEASSVSFGQIIAGQVGEDAAFARDFDARVARGYRDDL